MGEGEDVRCRKKKKQTEKEILYLEWANRFRKHTTHTFISFLFRSSYSPIKLNDFLFGLILTPFENIYEKKKKQVYWMKSLSQMLTWIEAKKA